MGIVKDFTYFTITSGNVKVSYIHKDNIYDSVSNVVSFDNDFAYSTSECIDIQNVLTYTASYVKNPKFSFNETFKGVYLANTDIKGSYLYTKQHKKYYPNFGEISNNYEGMYDDVNIENFNNTASNYDNNYKLFTNSFFPQSISFTTTAYNIYDNINHDISSKINITYDVSNINRIELFECNDNFEEIDNIHAYLTINKLSITSTKIGTTYLCAKSKYDSKILSDLLKINISRMTNVIGISLKYDNKTIPLTYNETTINFNDTTTYTISLSPSNAKFKYGYIYPINETNEYIPNLHDYELTVSDNITYTIYTSNNNLTRIVHFEKIQAS